MFKIGPERVGVALVAHLLAGKFEEKGLTRHIRPFTLGIA